MVGCISFLFQDAAWNAIKAVVLQTGLLRDFFFFLVSKWDGNRLQGTKVFFFSKCLHMNFSQKVFLACQKKKKRKIILEVNVSSAVVESLFRLVV